MFDIGWSEMALILLVALIVIGPKDLPRVARSVGQWVAKGRGMAREFQRALEDMAREAELDKVKSEIEKAGRTDIGRTIEKTIDPSGELSKALDPRADMAPTGAKSAAAAAAPAAAATPAAATSSPAIPAPAGNGGVAPPARKAAPAGEKAAPAARKAAPAARKAAPAARKEAAAAPAPAAPAKRTRRAPATNGAGGAKDAGEPARAPAPAETS